MPGDAGLATTHRNAFSDDIVPLGYVRDFALAVHGFDADDLAAITFTPTDIFQQTPGPGAGGRIGR